MNIDDETMGAPQQPDSGENDSMEEYCFWTTSSEDPYRQGLFFYNNRDQLCALDVSLFSPENNEENGPHGQDEQIMMADSEEEEIFLVGKGALKEIRECDMTPREEDRIWEGQTEGVGPNRR